MYGSELAANHLFGKNNKILKTNELDVQSSSDSSLDKCLHVHSWHSNDFYSKFKYEAGDYKNRECDANSTKINDFSFCIVKNAEYI